MTAAGLTEDGKSKYALHCLRHNFASWCIKLRTVVAEKCPPRLFRSFWGTRLDLYGHLFSSGDARADLAAAKRVILV